MGLPHCFFCYGLAGVGAMFEAARFGDEISHSSALGGFLIGAVLGIALIATVAIATFTCGFGVAL
ncbi:YD repeat protein, partial [Pseudomonas amygdali]